LLHKIEDLLYQSILSLAERPLPELLKKLRALRNNLPDHSPEFSRFDDVLIPLFIKERDEVLSRDISHNDDPQFIHPQLEDILLTDVDEKIIKTDIASQLDITYLSDYVHNEPSWPCGGIIFGKNKRLFINLAVRRKENDNYKNVIFLVDTGCPSTFICRHAIESLIPADSPLPLSFLGYIHDINVLGADFMSEAMLVLNVVFSEYRFTLSK